MANLAADIAAVKIDIDAINTAVTDIHDVDLPEVKINVATVGFQVDDLLAISLI